MIVRLGKDGLFVAVNFPDFSCWKSNASPIERWARVS
jgi:hypothetical protein